MNNQPMGMCAPCVFTGNQRFLLVKQILQLTLHCAMATLPGGANRRVLKEGTLQKRQRGKSVRGQDFSGLKFQNRYVRLDTDSLRYYRKVQEHACSGTTRLHNCMLEQDKKFRGRFPVSSIAFVEKIPLSTFVGVKYGFQVCTFLTLSVLCLPGYRQ